MIIAIFILVIQTILFLGHLFVYKSIVHFFHVTNQSHLWWLRAVFLVLSISFLVASMLAFRFYGGWVRAIYIPAAFWIGTLYFLMVASLLSWIIKWVLPGRDVTSVAVGLMIIAVLFSFYGLWHSYQTKVTKVAIKLDNLPASWLGRRAVLVADTHLGNVRNVAFAKKIVSLINEQKPDIVLVPGDFFDGTPENFTALAAPFGEIKSTFGVYFGSGNHEEFGDSSPFLLALKGAGVKVMDSKMESVQGLQIVGIDFALGRSKEKEKAMINNLQLDKNLPSILIKHEPSHIDAAEETGISLQVSGHTHNGQVWPIGLITKMVYGKYYRGLNNLNNTQVYTTQGAGTWGPPQRFGADSEIVVITFE